MSSIIKAIPAPTWSNAAPENWQPYRKKMLRYFTKAGLSWAVPGFQGLTRAKPPTDDVKFMEQFSQAYCVIADTVPGANLEEINELMDTTIRESPEAAPETAMGGSIATRDSTCMRWFWTTSRIMPALSK